MKSYSAITLCLVLGTMLQARAQNCQSEKDLETVPGKQIDAAHWEWPQEKAHWMDELGTTANKSAAGNVLTQIELLEKQSRKNFTLTGCVLKNSFSGNAIGYTASKYPFAPYDLNIGCHEYICVKNTLKVNGEYSIVFRAYINRFKDITYAFSTLDHPEFYAVPDKYDGKYIALHDFIRFSDNKIFEAINNNGKSFYQDVPDDKVKPGDRSIFITRHWYFTKPGIPLFVPVSRKEYLQALLEYYDREKIQTAAKVGEIEKTYATATKNATGNQQRLDNAKRTYTVQMAHYPDWQQRIATKIAFADKALKENTAEWLSKPAW